MGELDAVTEHSVTSHAANRPTSKYQTKWRGVRRDGTRNNGDFVVAYVKDYFNECSTQYYFLRRIFADGTPKGPNILINDKSNCSDWIQPTVRISSDSAGNLLSVFPVNTGWEEDRWNVWAQRFDNEGNRIGGDYRINDIPAKYPYGPILYLGADVNNAGLMAAAWWEDDALAPGWNLALQTMDIADIGYKCGDANATSSWMCRMPYIYSATFSLVATLPKTSVLAMAVATEW